MEDFRVPAFLALCCERGRPGCDMLVGHYSLGGQDGWRISFRPAEWLSVRVATAGETRGTRGSSDRGQRRRSPDLPTYHARRTTEAPRCLPLLRGGQLR